MSASTTEAASAAALRDPLLQGLTVLTQDQQIPFVQYTRYVLPLDGYVFWLKTQETCIKGSMHVAARKDQREDETIAVNRVVFTTGDMVQEFNEIGPNTIWVGCAGGNKFAFSQSGPIFRNTGIFHYSGDAVYPALESQLVDTGAQLPTSTLIVSNSLPAWLALATYDPVWLIAGNPGITLYPSFLVPDNLRPPYGTVHIPEEQTQPLSAFPAITYGGEHSQLATDRVRITLYGATNAQALAFLDLVNQYSRDTNTIGMMAPSIVRDAKRTQPEMGIIAMKKTIDFQVSYLQDTIPGVGWQLILNALVTILPATYGVQ